MDFSRHGVAYSEGSGLTVQEWSYDIPQLETFPIITAEEQFMEVVDLSAHSFYVEI